MSRCLSQVGAVLLAGLLVGCASAGTRPGKPQAAAAKRPAPAAAAARPALAPPRAVAPAPPEVDGQALTGAPDPATVPDAVPVPTRVDTTSRPYQIYGRTYVPQTEDLPTVERGVASWYGRRFHGRRTASGEIYDMHAMTAAHPTLPLPSYAVVRNPTNGREVVVRVNDRGPFHPGRIIDLSHVAAVKLGVHGLAHVEVRRLTNDEIRTGSWRRDTAPTEGWSAAEDRRLALRRTEAQLAAAELAPAPESATDTAMAPSTTLAAASAPGPADAAASVPAVSVALAASSARSGEPVRTLSDADRPLAPESVLAALPPAAGASREPVRVAATAPPAAHAASSAGKAPESVLAALPPAAGASREPVRVAATAPPAAHAASSAGKAAESVLAALPPAAPASAEPVRVVTAVPPVAHAASSAGKSPEAVLAARPPVAAAGAEPVRVVAAPPAVAHAASSAGGIALPVGLTGYWVQLGAFRLRDGAESFRRRVAAEMAWIGPVLSVLSDADLHRLQAGPYPSRDQAHGVAQRLREVLRLAPVIVERR